MTPKFNIGETIFLKTDIDQLPRIVIGYTVRAFTIMYDLACGNSSSWHYDIEISKVKSELTSVKGLCRPGKK